MAMLASDALKYERILLATPGGANSRWQDSQLLTLTDRAVKSLVAAILFPESRLTLTGGTIANQQEYVLPDMHEVYRVYLNGQIIVEVPGNIDTLEGRQILLDDQLGQGIPINPGSGGPPGGGGTSQPQWAIQTPTTYPFLNAWGNPAPNAQPWTTGQRARFYRRGGSIGIVPAPGNAGEALVVEGVRVPSTLTQTGDPIIVPDNFMEAIANFVCYRALSADKDDLSIQMSDRFYAAYEREVRKLRTWKRQYSNEDGALLPLTYRQSFAIGGNRNGGSFW